MFLHFVVLLVVVRRFVDLAAGIVVVVVVDVIADELRHFRFDRRLRMGLLLLDLVVIIVEGAASQVKGGGQIVEARVRLGGRGYGSQRKILRYSIKKSDYRQIEWIPDSSI